MEAEFLEYLRERGTCGTCDHHCGGACDKADTILWMLRDVAPVLRFECDRDAPAVKCEWWEPESDWAGSLRRSYRMECEEAASAQGHRLDVAAVKGFEVAA